MPRPTPPTINSALRAQRAYIARKREAGLVRIVEWVPTTEIDALRDIARQLRVAQKNGETRI